VLKICNDKYRMSSSLFPDEIQPGMTFS
jgi:hypothetical protein